MLYMTSLIHLAEEMITHDQPIAIHVTGPDDNEHAVTIHAIADNKGWPKFEVEHWLVYQPGHPGADPEDAFEWNSIGHLVNTSTFDHAVNVAAQALIAILQGNEPQYVNMNGEPA